MSPAPWFGGLSSRFLGVPSISILRDPNLPPKTHRKEPVEKNEGCKEWNWNQPLEDHVLCQGPICQTRAAL